MKEYKRCPKCHGTRWNVQEISTVGLSWVFDSKDGSWNEMELDEVFDTESTSAITCAKCGHSLAVDDGLLDGPTRDANR